jgi:hypothetical protein
MKNYLVTLISRDSGDLQRIVVQSECPCGMQEFVDGLSDLHVTSPVVVDINETAASHLPQVDPT